MEKYLFYSIVGSHGGETVKEILARKQKEVERCNYSLWSARIYDISMQQAWSLNKSDEVAVYCKVKYNNTNDPIDLNNIYHAKFMIGSDNKKIAIPDGIDTTFTKGNNYQAYVVKNYELFEKPIIFDFGKYETIMQKNHSIVSFKDRFNGSTHFQNVFGKENSLLDEICEQIIGMKMELTYPFVVNLE